MEDGRAISEGTINRNDAMMDKGTTTAAAIKEGQTRGRTQGTPTQGEKTLDHMIAMEDKIIHLPDTKKGAANRTDGKLMNAATSEDKGTSQETTGDMMTIEENMMHTKTEQGQLPVHVTRDSGTTDRGQVHQDRNRLGMIVHNVVITLGTAEDKTILNHVRGHNNQLRVSPIRQVRVLAFVTDQIV